MLRDKPLWLEELSPRLYKPRVVITCTSLEKALSYMKSLKVASFDIIRCSQLSEDVVMKYVKADFTGQQGLVIVADTPLDEKTRFLIRALNPYMPIVIVHPNPQHCSMLKISGRELDCYRALL